LGKTVLVVAHGGILNSIFKRIVGQDLTAPRRFGITNAAVSQVTMADGDSLKCLLRLQQFKRGAVLTPCPPFLRQLRYTKDKGWFIQMWNDTSHLQELGFLHI
jgi:broad specificity phosphatase PhoE